VVHDIWVALSLWARETIDGYFSARIRDFLLAPKFTRLFSSCIRGGTRPRWSCRPRCLARWEYGRVWNHNSRPPPPAPPYKEEGSPEFAALYRFDFWKTDLGAFTGRGQGGPCLTDAAQ